jgi:hypothetical protein
MYWALLRWGALRIPYGAALLNRAHGSPMARYTLRPGAAPTVDPSGAVKWRCERLNAAGTWRRAADPIEHTLLQTTRGAIHWRCVCPKADVTVRLGERTLCGLGYAEHMTMTLVPWQLPVHELRWGRFLSHTAHVTWIAWTGELQRSWVFEDGTVHEAVAISSAGLTVPGTPLTLTLSDGRVLRSGRLRSTALYPLRSLVWLIPGWRGARETKWVARGSLMHAGGASDGWTIHEVVRWG